jgi:hypothetical protein
VRDLKRERSPLSGLLLSHVETKRKPTTSALFWRGGILKIDFKLPELFKAKATMTLFKLSVSVPKDPMAIGEEMSGGK